MEEDCLYLNVWTFTRQGVILVTINDRLNIFAWMTHPELNEESEHKVSGNYGLLDQIFALSESSETSHLWGESRTTLPSQASRLGLCPSMLC